MKDTKSTFSESDKFVGLKRLAAFHLNDSMKDFHSRVDRHQHIGKGFIGLDAFRRLLNDPRFFGLPMCLETDPGTRDERGCREPRDITQFD